MSNTVEQVEKRLSRLIDEKLPTNHRGEITAEVLRNTFKIVVGEVLREVETLVRSARIALSPDA